MSILELLHPGYKCSKVSGQISNNAAIWGLEEEKGADFVTLSYVLLDVISASARIGSKSGLLLTLSAPGRRRRTLEGTQGGQGQEDEEEWRQPRAGGDDSQVAASNSISGRWKSVLNANQMSCLFSFSGAGRIHRHKKAYGLDKKYN